MIERAEIARALKGSWRLLLGDERAMAWFDTSIDGFWRSFRVILLVLPVPLVELAAQRSLPDAVHLDPKVFEGPFYWIVGLLAYVVAWIAFPIVLALLAKPLGVSRAYVPYMVARNWTTLVAAVPSFVFTGLFALGVIPLGVLGPLNLAALAFGLYYAWLVTRIACAVPMGLAAGLVALDFLLTLVVYRVADRVIGL
jgi:hypothetical protein